MSNEKHYLGSIRRHLKRLYEVYPNDPVLREQLSDEVDWIDATLGADAGASKELVAAAPALLEACSSVWLMLSDTKDNELRLVADECRAAIVAATSITIG